MHADASVDPAAFEYVPATQDVQLVAPAAAAYDPATHVEHAVAPTVLEKRPAAQGRQPAEDAYVPTAQLEMHAVAPDAEYAGAHVEHADAPAAENVPAAHAAHPDASV